MLGYLDSDFAGGVDRNTERQVSRACPSCPNSHTRKGEGRSVTRLQAGIKGDLHMVVIEAVVGIIIWIWLRNRG